LNFEEIDHYDEILGAANPEFEKALQLLAKLKVKNSQFDIDGERNIWIIKPSG
jgi:hypothetical protein